MTFNLKTVLTGCFLLLVVMACNSEKEKEAKSKLNFKDYNNKKTTKTTEVSEVPIDLSNKGLGPIKSLEFGDLDEDLASKGGVIFKQKCTACHKTDKRYQGPALKGVYERRSPEWVMNIMLNPTEMLKKDPIAIAQLKEYNNLIMLDQNLSEEEARALAEYFRTL